MTMWKFKIGEKTILEIPFGTENIESICRTLCENYQCNELQINMDSNEIILVEGD